VSWSLLTLITTAVVSLTQAQRAPLYNFIDESTSVKCNDTEWKNVLQVMGNATVSSDRRRLGAGPSAQRKLSCPKWCGKYCAMMGVGCAQRGRRRYLQGNDSMEDITPCGADIAAIDTALAGYTGVSSQCQAVLAGQKTVSCPYYTTEDCFITGISVWEPKLIKLNATGNVWCHNKRVNFLVDTTFIAGNVNMTLWYTSNQTEPMKLFFVYRKNSAPYYMFGTGSPRNNSAGSLFLPINTIKLAVGWWSLAVVAGDNPSDVKTANFEVRQCW
jgi:hypothetical protein